MRLLLPAEALRQSGIAGAVLDQSAVPSVLHRIGVDPALIEAPAPVVTYGQVLNLVDLRPGAYVVTFSLPGFSTLRREGIELTAGFTATVNAELSLGALEETITVSGEAPVVDIRNVRTQTTVDRETLTAIPTTGRMGQYAALIAGATLETTTLHDVGGVAGERGQFGVHGQRAADISYVQAAAKRSADGGVQPTKRRSGSEHEPAACRRRRRPARQVKVVSGRGNIWRQHLRGDPNPSRREQITDDLAPRLTRRGLKSYRSGGGLEDPSTRTRCGYLCLPVLKSASITGQILQTSSRGSTSEGSVSSVAINPT